MADPERSAKERWRRAQGADSSPAHIIVPGGMGAPNPGGPRQAVESITWKVESEEEQKKSRVERNEASFMDHLRLSTLDGFYGRIAQSPPQFVADPPREFCEGAEVSPPRTVQEGQYAI